VNELRNSRLWLEVVSALGVIVGLGFVGWELRQSTKQSELNTRATEVAAYQDLIGQISELNRFQVESPEFAELQNRFFAGDTTLTVGELGQMRGFLWSLFRHGDMAFYQYERGVLGRERLESALSPLTSRLRIPVMRPEWETRRASFAPSFQVLIDSILNVP